VGFRIDQGGESAVLAGDTIPCSSLDELCAGADLKVQTVIRPDLGQLLPNARIQDILDLHSTVEEAAQTAARAGARTLVLTHYVPPLIPGQEDEWRALAAAHFDGPIVLGDDLTRIAASG
jgi:ribonuclease Z